MGRLSRPITAVACAAAVVVSSVVAADAGPSRSRDDAAATTRQEAQQEGGGEYVVVFEGSADAGVAAVEAAGGTVLDVNEDANIALVSADDASVAGAVATADGVGAAVRNHAIGETERGMAHRFAEERPTASERATARSSTSAESRRGGGRGEEPLADLQWNMDAIGTDAAHRRATGEGVDVGIIDTGIDASHPDLAPNFDPSRSRNFTMDIPAIDGPCEYATCIDPANVDHGGHGSHVSGIIAGARNGFGVEGVAPDATLVNLRAGQDSGYFFLYETVAALTEAGNLGLDVVNMSFYTDPWLFNCDSRDDYLSGDVSDEELAEQATVRQLVLAATRYATDRGVTLVGSAGNEHTDLSVDSRADASSPDYPPETARERTVSDDCMIVPNESPDVLSVVSLGPSGTKSDFSNYGLGEVEVSAPGGWFRDNFGTPEFQVPENMVLSSYSLEAAITDGLVDENGDPVDDFTIKQCEDDGTCALFTYLQGTSMASPHVAGVAALVVERYGQRTRGGGRVLAPGAVKDVITRTAVNHACPAGGVEDYSDEGRDPTWNATCVGTVANNSIYGEGVVNAAAAVSRR
jgi:lantibiotic leader peptide-processing serine protease